MTTPSLGCESGPPEKLGYFYLLEAEQDRVVSRKSPTHSHLSHYSSAWLEVKQLPLACNSVKLPRGLRVGGGNN